MADVQQFRKELFAKAQQIRELLKQQLASLPDEYAHPPGTTAVRPSLSTDPPVQSLHPPAEHMPDFPLADFPDAVKKLKQILIILRRHRDAGPFNQPVDPAALQIPDYPSIVKRPMDLGTVTRKLDGHHKHYKTAQDVAEDVRLIWNNCKLPKPIAFPHASGVGGLGPYNGQLHPLSRTASDLERLFEARFQGVLDRYATPDSNSAKRQKVEDSRSTEPEAAWSLEQPMTFDEKQVLGQLIGALDNVYSQQVFQLIQTSCPSALDDTAEDVELDIEKLDVRTARELERFVKSVAAGQ